MKRLVDEAGEVGADVDRRVLLELREYFLPEQLYVLHDALVREVPVLHAAHHLIDPQVGIALHLLEALLGIANDILRDLPR